MISITHKLLGLAVLICIAGVLALSTIENQLIIQIVIIVCGAIMILILLFFHNDLTKLQRDLHSDLPSSISYSFKSVASISQTVSSLKKQKAICENRLAVIDVENKQTQNKKDQFITQMASTSDKEKLDLVRDLHDELNARIISIRSTLEIVESSKTLEPELVKKLAKAIERMNDFLAFTRNIIHGMIPENILSMGLTSAVDTLSNTFQEDHPKVVVSKEIDGTLNELREDLITDEMGLAVYRIIQEALNNVAKHANAKQVHISVKVQSRASVRYLVFSVKDDGCGFDQLALDPSKCYGLGIMKNRAMEYRGTLSIDSAIGKGTSVKGYIPI